MWDFWKLSFLKLVRWFYGIGRVFVLWAYWDFFCDLIYNWIVDSSLIIKTDIYSQYEIKQFLICYVIQICIFAHLSMVCSVCFWEECVELLVCLFLHGLSQLTFVLWSCFWYMYFYDSYLIVTCSSFSSM